MALTHLKNIASGVPTEEVDTESAVFRKLIAQTAGGRPAWEDVSSTDISGLKRYLVAQVTPLTLTTDETFKVTAGVGKGGTIESVTYTPDEAITGVTTNGRTLTVVDLDDTKTKAEIEFKTGTNAVAGTATALTIGDPVLGGGESLKVASKHNGTGIADPGGVVLIEVKYTA